MITLSDNITNRKVTRKKVSFSKNIEMFKRINKDYLLIQSHKRKFGYVKENTLPRYTRTYLIDMIEEFNDMKYWNYTRKRFYDVVSNIAQFFPYEIDQAKLKLALAVQEWKDNGLRNRDIETKKYYRVVSFEHIGYEKYNHIYTDKWGHVKSDSKYRYKFKNSNFYCKESYIVKITNKSEKHLRINQLPQGDLNRSLCEFSAIRSSDISNVIKLHASQLVDDVKIKEIEEFEKSRREYLVSKLKEQADIFQKNFKNANEIIETLTVQIDHNIWHNPLTIKIPLFDEIYSDNFKITKSY